MHQEVWWPKLSCAAELAMVRKRCRYAPMLVPGVHRARPCPDKHENAQPRFVVGFHGHVELMVHWKGRTRPRNEINMPKHMALSHDGASPDTWSLLPGSDSIDLGRHSRICS